MKDKVVLLGAWPSSYVIRATIGLAEKDVEYEYKEENLADKSLLLLQMSPIHKKVPVLIHNGKSVCESLIIVEYIDDVWNKKSPLLPSDPYQRAQARFWADYMDKKIFANVRAIMLEKGEEQESAKKYFIEGLKTMEKELGDKAYFGGETFGFVDLALVPIYCCFYALETCGNFKVEAECPKIIAWAKRCMKRGSVAKSLPTPHKFYEFVLLLKKRLGIE